MATMLVYQRVEYIQCMHIWNICMYNLKILKNINIYIYIYVYIYLFIYLHSIFLTIYIYIIPFNGISWGYDIFLNMTDSYRQYHMRQYEWLGVGVGSME